MKRAKRFQEGGDVAEKEYEAADDREYRRQIDSAFGDAGEKAKSKPKARRAKPIDRELMGNGGYDSDKVMQSRGALRGVRSDAADNSGRFPPGAFRGKRSDADSAADKPKQASAPGTAMYTGDEAANDFVREARPGRRRTALYGNSYQPGKSSEAANLRKMAPVAIGYAKGGYVRSADGCCQRGKTKGTFR